MSDHPILFSGAMVRAILEGRKTMTRRVCIPRFDDRTPCEHYGPQGTDFMARHCEHGSEGQRCPHGLPGDRLWVRETFARCACGKQECTALYFRADGPVVNDGAQRYAWRPSIFMPRWASRITLELTAVRVERLQDMTDADAIAEGLEGCANFRELWDSLNAKRGYSWAKNPWVWVLSFKRTEARQ